MPPNVITLIDISYHQNTSAVTSTESGMAVSVINVVRRFSKNTSSTITTSAAPMYNASATFCTP